VGRTTRSRQTAARRALPVECEFVLAQLTGSVTDSQEQALIGRLADYGLPQPYIERGYLDRYRLSMARAGAVGVMGGLVGAALGFLPPFIVIESGRRRTQQAAAQIIGPVDPHPITVPWWPYVTSIRCWFRSEQC
jgi:hypothetical protein